MRALPSGWPTPGELVTAPPKLYLRMLDAAWPPASNVDGEILPAGTTVVGSANIKRQLRAPLLPGQINSDPKFTVATAECTIPQREGGLLAPWRTGAEQTPSPGRCQLIASYNGPDGSTAFELGRFVLDPIEGKLSDPFLTVSMLQDLSRLQRDHSIPGYNPAAFGGTWANSFQIVEYAATSAGFAFTTTGSFPSGVSFAYFPRHTTQLAAMQQVVSANLSAMFLSDDGTTIRALHPDYLLGAGALTETLDVMSVFADLSWSQDPNAKIDRVEVIYLPPTIDDGPLGPVPFNTGSVWTAPKRAGIGPGDSRTFEFDPGSFASPLAFGGVFQIMVNANKDGSGSDSYLNGTIVQLSSGCFRASIINSTGDTKYFTLPYDTPGGVDRGWGVSKGTPSFIPGIMDRANESDGSKTLAWGVAADAAANTLSFDLGRLVQHDSYAADIFNRVVARVNHPTFVVEGVPVVPNLGRELGDLHRTYAKPYGFDQRALITGNEITIDAKGVDQVLDYAMLPLTSGDGPI